LYFHKEKSSHGDTLTRSCCYVKVLYVLGPGQSDMWRWYKL